MKFRDRVLSGAQRERVHGNWIEVTGGDIVQGRNFTPAEATNGARVVVINETMAQRLFNGVDPLGKDVLLSKSPFMVIGIYKAAGDFMGDAASRGARAVRGWPPVSATCGSTGSTSPCGRSPASTRDEAIDDVVGDAARPCAGCARVSPTTSPSSRRTSCSRRGAR